MALTSGIMWMGKIWPGEWYGRELTPAELFGMLKGMGLETIDIFARAADVHGVDTLKAALEDSGLRCACYYISADLVTEEPEKARLADEASRAASRSHSSSAPPSFSPTAASTPMRAGEPASAHRPPGRKAAAPRGTDLTLVIENAGYLLHEADKMVRVCEALGDLRLCPDTGNFTLWGQDEIDAVKKCLPWAAHFHMARLRRALGDRREGRGHRGHPRRGDHAGRGDCRSYQGRRLVGGAGMGARPTG